MYKRDGTKMRKNFKFDKLDEWIKAEYDRETKGIEDSLSDDGSFDPNKIDSQELYQRIQSRIREKEEQETKSEVQEKRRGITRQRVGKCAALFCVAVTGVFLASMTSEANRSYFMYKMQYLIGDEAEADVGSEADSNNIVKKKRQEKIGEEIESQLDVLVPYFEYGLQLDVDDAYNIEPENAVAAIEYQYSDNVINLKMVNRNKTDTVGLDFRGKEIAELKLKRETIIIHVMKTRDNKDEEDVLTAQWEYQNGNYQLTGKVKKSEFIKILKSISY